MFTKENVRIVAKEIASEFQTVLALSDLHDLEEQIYHALVMSRRQALEDAQSAVASLPESHHPDARWAIGRSFGISLAHEAIKALLFPEEEPPHA